MTMFEIKIALLGNVSVGKTTILNALLRDKFSEVTRKRGTGGINFFRISQKEEEEQHQEQHPDSVEKSPKSSKEEINYRPASSILNEIVADNETLRGTKTIQEKTFHVQLQEPLCGETRHDTRLVFVDIPGVNDSGSGEIYMDYVNENWETFDLVVLVMDGTQGVDGEEQVELLRIVQENISSIKDVPVVVLCNKIDEPDDEELASLVDEAREKVQEVFGVDCRAEALTSVLEKVENEQESNYVLDLSPTFIPISAGNAFLYRVACGLSFEDFKKLDRQIIDKIGRNEVRPSKRRKLSEEEKYKAAYAAVGDASEYAERVELTNFDKFLKVVAYFVGGKDTQRVIIESQLNLYASNLSWKTPFAHQLSMIHDRSQVVGKSTVGLRDTFFKLCKELIHHAESTFSASMDLEYICFAMDQLIDYVMDLNKKIHTQPDGMVDGGWKAKEKEAIQMMKKLVAFQCATICEKLGDWRFGDAAYTAVSKTWTSHGYQNWSNVYSNEKRYGTHPPDVDSPLYWKKQPAMEGDSTVRWRHDVTGQIVESTRHPQRQPPTWTGLSPYDWNSMIGSVLNNPDFGVHFGRQKMELEIRQRIVAPWLVGSGQKGLTNGGVMAASVRMTLLGQGIAAPSLVATNNYHQQQQQPTEMQQAMYVLQECLAGKYVQGEFVPHDKVKYDLAVQIKTPEDLSDPKHWGHLAWKFGRFVSAYQPTT